MNNTLILKKFNHPELGDITTISYFENVMFLGMEIAKIWGHSNITQAVKNAQLKSYDYSVFTTRNSPEFLRQLKNSSLIGMRARGITLLTESGLFKLAFTSRLDNPQRFKNKLFRNWISQIIKLSNTTENTGSTTKLFGNSLKVKI